MDVNVPNVVKPEIINTTGMVVNVQNVIKFEMNNTTGAKIVKGVLNVENHDKMFINW
jgi:hypothetical protein